MQIDQERCHPAHVPGGAYHVWEQNKKWCQCGERVSPAWLPFMRRMRNRWTFKMMQRRLNNAHRQS